MATPCQICVRPLHNLVRSTCSRRFRTWRLVFLDYSALKYHAGAYDQATAMGVAALQEALGIAPTGVYDSVVRAHLQRALDS